MDSNLELPLEIHLLNMGYQWKRDSDMFQGQTGLVLTGVLTGVGTLVCLVVSPLLPSLGRVSKNPKI